MAASLSGLSLWALKERLWKIRATSCLTGVTDTTFAQVGSELTTVGPLVS
jgi:hypothetical protein